MKKEDEKELMDQALQETSVFGKDLADACNSINHHFQLGKNQEGIELLHQFFEGIGCLSQAIHMTQPLQQERQIALDLTPLPPILEPLVAALENKDYGLIGDILLYEMQPVLTTWSDQLGRKAMAS